MSRDLEARHRRGGRDVQGLDRLRHRDPRDDIAAGADEASQAGVLGAEHEHERPVGDRELGDDVAAARVEPDRPHARSGGLVERGRDTADERDRQVLDRARRGACDCGCHHRRPVRGDDDPRRARAERAPAYGAEVARIAHLVEHDEERSLSRGQRPRVRVPERLDPGGDALVVACADELAQLAIRPELRLRLGEPRLGRHRTLRAPELEHLPIAVVTNLARYLEEVKGPQLWVYGAAGDAPDDLWDTDLSGGVAIVLGAEGKGLRPLVRRTCDALVSIPLEGPVESLNVSVAAAVFLFEARRQRST